MAPGAAMTGTTHGDLAQQIQAEMTAVVDTGIDVEDVTITKAGRRQLVRVVIDRDGGVDLDLVASVSHQVSEILDRPEYESVLGDAYVLEVTSPGTDRPLTSQAHWRRAVTRLVNADFVDGTSISARITSVDAGVVVLQPEKGDALSVPLAELLRGTVQVEFNRSEKE
jgi:ribosome maturation factor RimP